MSLVKKFALPVVMCTTLAFASVAFAGGGPPPALTTPGITCVSSTASSITVQVCGTGTNGAPAGFSIHMKTLADYNIDGWDATGSYTCLSLGGNCQGGVNPWSLSAGECVNVVISASTVIDYAAQGICGVSSDCGIDPLQCATTYVFRVFAHGGGGFGISDKGPDPPLQCTTADCTNGGGCTFTWGYWKTHGPEDGCSPGNQENDWDVASLNIGLLDLNQAALCAILQENPSACGKGGGANAVLILEHQLIAAMLNVANGAIDCQVANDAIVSANALLEGREYDCVGTASVLGQQMIAVKDVLAAYNSDICSCPTSVEALKGGATPTGTTVVKKATWGQAKSFYR